ncbi:MEKHLA domain-containing protein [Chamaesiphon sp. VAR_48_metabat_403]|uniref:MEKHLA domain-containing protein n=1 Tax=Chamaesiphon sp. VAR_48_metabat_403 TaxID=2964700 RepID=UPI00286DCB87|nr:MEKHLA domain-containing protein [Chamaesiphon sp. VAR_48_metabat_403]
MIGSPLSPPAPENNYHQEHVVIMLKNLHRWTGCDLIQEYGFSLAKLGQQVFEADFYILSHDNTTDPILTYGNQRVLDLWEVSWAELTTMHSSTTAKLVDRSARAAMMERVKIHNYLDNYNGIRVSKTGTEFQIVDGTIWNLFIDKVDFYGQAAWFKSIKK